MRIFLALHPSGNLGIPGSLTWIRNLYEPLLQMGHEVYLFRLDKASDTLGIKFRGPGFKQRLGPLLLDTFLKEHTRKRFQLFLSYLTDMDVDAVIISRLHTHGIPMANFSCNNTHQFHLVENISPGFSYNLHAEKDAADRFREINAHPYWFQMAANPDFYKPVSTSIQYEISFAGMMYANRARYIGHLLREKFPVHCFGPNWILSSGKKFRKELKRMFYLLRSVLTNNSGIRHRLSSWIRDYDYFRFITGNYREAFHHPISDENLVKLYSASRINLGFLEVFGDDNRPGSPLMHHLHLREFEVPMSGGLYFTNYSAELSEHYEPDREIVVYRNEHELADKAKYYLSHEKEAERIRKAGFLRATGCHTWKHRFELLFNEIGLGNKR